MKSRENYIYLLYRDIVINTSAGAICKVDGVFVCLCVPSEQFKEAVLTHLFVHIFSHFPFSLLHHFVKIIQSEINESLSEFSIIRKAFVPAFQPVKYRDLT